VAPVVAPGGGLRPKSGEEKSGEEGEGVEKREHSSVAEEDDFLPGIRIGTAKEKREKQATIRAKPGLRRGRKNPETG